MDEEFPILCYGSKIKACNLYTFLQVYFDFMRSFRVEFDEYFEDGFISMIEVGLGPCGELRYPSCPVKHGWRYPGIGEFQVNSFCLQRELWIIIF